jgi:hypothetical protein
MGRLVAMLVVALLSACQAGTVEGPPDVEPRTVVLGAFEAEVDPARGTMTVRVVPESAAAARRAGLQIIGEGTGADTVTLTTTGVQSVVGGCNPGDDFQGIVAIKSNFATNMVVNVYAEITSIPTGREGCNSVRGHPPGLSSQYGLWRYGPIGPGNTATQLWKLRNPSSTSYTFSGVVKGTIIPPIAPTKYATGANPVKAVFDGTNVWVANQATASGQSSQMVAINAATGTPKAGSPFTLLAYPMNVQTIISAENNQFIWAASANATAGTGVLQKYLVSNGAAQPQGFAPGFAFNPVALSANPQDNEVYAADRANDRVRFINGNTALEERESPIAVPSSPVAEAFDGTSATWVASAGTVADGLNVTVIPANYVLGHYAGGTTPVAIVHDSATSSMWIADQGAYQVRKHSKAAPATFTAFDLESAPDKLAFDPGTSSVWVLSIADQTLAKVRASDGAVLAQYALAFVPSCITYVPTTPATLWICDTTNGGIWKWTIP